MNTQEIKQQVTARLQAKAEALNDQTDQVMLSIPLFIRCLEWAREDAKSDVEIHLLVENVVAQNTVLTTEDYDMLIPQGDSNDNSND